MATPVTAATQEQEWWKEHGVKILKSLFITFFVVMALTNFGVSFSPFYMFVIIFALLHFGWLRTAGRTTGLYLVYILISFTACQVIFRFFPVDAYNQLLGEGGFGGMFWGHKYYVQVVEGIVIFGVIGWAFLQRKKFLPRMVLGLIALLVVLGVAFPEERATWPAKRAAVGEQMARDGIVPTTLSIVTGNPTPAEIEVMFPGLDRESVQKDSPITVTGDTEIPLASGGYHGPVVLGKNIAACNLTHERSSSCWAAMACGSYRGKPHKGNEDFTQEDVAHCLNPNTGLATFYLQGSCKAIVDDCKFR